MNLAPEACYFIATVLLILGLRRMSSPRTARGGIVWAGAGMALAVAAAFAFSVRGHGLHDRFALASPHRMILILVGIAAGGIPAWWTGKKVAVTNMPQMVAIYNGLGGGAASTIGAVELYSGHAYAGSLAFPVIAVLGVLIGTVAFGGSLVAFLKLQGWMGTLRFPGRHPLNALLLAAAVVLGLACIFPGPVGDVVPISLYEAVGFFLLVSLAVGLLITLPIGGADMPVVISTYNACIGIAVAFEGFVVQNPAMIIAGTVVGAAGTLLTVLMAKAMNRTIGNVWFSDFGSSKSTAVAKGPAGTMKSVAPSDAAAVMAYAGEVIVVPGYGLAVAQAQHKLWEFIRLLQKRGVKVRFAIHPVAGRMPGHMSVLLAEAGVPYDLISDLGEINGDFANSDVALVIGANDVVNPAARTDKGSPIYGMPILNVDQAKQVFVIKRGKGTGFSNIENELFFHPNTQMVFGDAQQVIAQMTQSLKEF
ncbi:MAG: NAD(P)(+) transhydrogenase (Re/Si-specific) subunit beta [Terriglobia bacterium]